jgi:hexosaminidase
MNRICITSINSVNNSEDIEDKNAAYAIQELCRRYSNIFSDEETDECSQCIKVCLEKSRDIRGYSIERTELDDTVKLCYDRIPSLLRALFKIAVTDEKEPAANGEAGEKTESIFKKGSKYLKGECRFTDFGVMIDVSRNAVPKVSTIKDMIFLCAVMGYTYVGLYMEDTIEIQDEPYFGYMRGAYSKAEIQEMDEYASELDMELRPFVQTLAHYNQLAIYEEYQRHMDAEDILLVGDRRAEELLEHLLATISSEFSTHNIHVGMDEAFLLGAGKYQERFGLETRDKIMKKQLDTVIRLCEKYNLRPEVWGDMFRHYGDDNSWIPDNLEIFYWDYYSTDEKHYDDEIKKYKKLTDNVSMAGGAWKWTGMIPCNEFSVRAGKASIEACVKNDIKSYVVTCWGDNGAEASHFSVLPVIYRDGQCAWDDKLPDRAFQLLIGIKIDDFMKIDRINPTHRLSVDAIRPKNGSKYFLYDDPLMGLFASLEIEGDADMIQRGAKDLDSMDEKSDFSYIMDAGAALGYAVCQKLKLERKLREAYYTGNAEAMKEISKKGIPDLIKKIDNYYASFKKQWYEENKAYGFEVQSIRIGGLKQRLLDVSNIVDRYLNGEISEIEELEAKHLPFNYFLEKNPDMICYNQWSNIVSTSVMG